uniref:Uncharacterized protein n=2 Tax=Cacopsylla melanoneura TaxID=428564 RepID=A0A8D8ZR51_9HEMI
MKPGKRSKMVHASPDKLKVLAEDREVLAADREVLVADREVLAVDREATALRTGTTHRKVGDMIRPIQEVKLISIPSGVEVGLEDRVEDLEDKEEDLAEMQASIERGGVTTSKLSALWM